MKMKEYQFKKGNVFLDVNATSKKEAVRIANEDLHLLDEPLLAPGVFQRVQIDTREMTLTEKDIVGIFVLNEDF